MSKVVIIDWGIFLHRSAYASVNNPNIPATYTCLNMILSCLKKIGLNPDDKVIIAVDGRNSWRKDYDTNYKGDRKEKRDKSGIDWTKEFANFDWLLKKIDEATDWNIVKEDRLEADDIMAVGSRFFKDKEIILVTYDSDLEQMFEYSNVKIFSPIKKAKGKKGGYKIKPKKFNVYKLISKKIDKEVSDNLTTPILNQSDYEKRNICVNLLKLPETVENTIKSKLNSLKNKEINLEKLPYKNLKSRFFDIYNSDDIVTYDYCVQLEAKRKNRRKKK